MYRISFSRSGYYFGQQRRGWGWYRCTRFCRTRGECRNLLRNLPSFFPRVIEYVN